VEILGTVAGDDTIICIADNNENAEKLIKFMQDKF
jgi:arginine repressor